MWELTKIELFKIFRKPRTFIAFGAIAIIVLLIQTGLYIDGQAYIEFGLQSITDSFTIEGKKLNGYFVCYVILQLLLIHVPLLIALVAGDMVAGEANMGTLRLLLTKPFSRGEILAGKMIASFIYTILLLAFMATLALLVSLFVFGTGDLIILKSDGIVLLDRTDILWRYFAAFGFAAIAMTTVAAMAFLFSVFAENSIGPIIITMCVIIVFTIFITLDIPLFNSLKPYIFTNHMLRWKDFFDMRVNSNNEGIIGSVQNLKGIINSALFLVVHALFFVSLAIISFRKKDILS